MKKTAEIFYEVKGLLPDAVVISLRGELTISEDLDNEVDTAATQFGWYAVLAEKAETRHQKMKFAAETWAAEIEAGEASTRESAGLKAHTEARMKAFVRSQPKYKAYQLKLIEFQEQARILKVIAKAFELKLALVQTKCANRRKEHYETPARR
jgi:hypothetical protein